MVNMYLYCMFTIRYVKTICKCKIRFLFEDKND